MSKGLRGAINDRENVGDAEELEDLLDGLLGGDHHDIALVGKTERIEKPRISQEPFTSSRIGVAASSISTASRPALDVAKRKKPWHCHRE